MDASRKRSRAVAVVLVTVVHLGLISLLTRSLASNVHSSYRIAAPPIRSSLIVQPRSPLLAKPERLPTKPTLASIQVALQPAPAFHRRIPPEPVPSAGPTRHATGSPARRGGGRSAHRRRSPLLSMSRRSIRARPRADCCARSSWYFRASRTAGRVRPSPARRVAQGALGGGWVHCEPSRSRAFSVMVWRMPEPAGMARDTYSSARWRHGKRMPSSRKAVHPSGRPQRAPAAGSSASREPCAESASRHLNFRVRCIKSHTAKPTAWNLRPGMSLWSVLQISPSVSLADQTTAIPCNGNACTGGASGEGFCNA